MPPRYRSRARGKSRNRSFGMAKKSTLIIRLFQKVLRARFPPEDGKSFNFKRLSQIKTGCRLAVWLQWCII